MRKKSREGARKYALEMSSPVRHLRTALDAAPSGAVSAQEIAQGYKHPIGGDYARLREHEFLKSEAEAKVWLMQEAARTMPDQLAIDGDTIALKPGLTPDDLRYQGVPIPPVNDINVVFRDVFSPMKKFSVNIRAVDKTDDMKELRELMKTFGWVEDLPAIQDERGVILMDIAASPWRRSWASSR